MKKNRPFRTFAKNETLKAQISKFLEGKTYEEIANLYNKLVPVSNRSWGTRLFASLSKAGRILKKEGFDFTGIADDDINMVILTIKDIFETTKNITPEKLQKFLFDKDGNGLLNKEQAEISDYVGQLRKANINLNDGEGFSAIIENLGLNSLMYSGENLYSVRTKFLRELKKYTGENVGMTVVELAKRGRMAEQVKNRVENQLKMKQQIEDAVLKKLENKTIYQVITGPDGKTQQVAVDNKVVAKKISSQSISYINGQIAAGKQFDLGEYVNGLSAGISVAKGGVGVNLSKTFANKYGTALTLSIDNFLNPSATLSQQFGGKIVDQVVSFDQMDVEGKLGANASITKSKTSLSGNITVSKISEKNIAGIEQMTMGADILLTKAFQDILAGKQAKYSNPKDQEAYNRMKENFDTGSAKLTQKGKEEYAKMLKNDFLTAYNDELYRNAATDDFKLTSIGLGVLAIPGFQVLPIVTGGMEKIKVSYKEEMRDISLQEKNTLNEGVDVKKYGMRREDYTNKNGETFKDVAKIPTTYKADHIKGGVGHLTLSVAPNSQAQIEKVNGEYVLSNLKQNSIHFFSTFENGRTTRTLVIDGGVKNAQGRYTENEKLSPITKGMEGETMKPTEKILENSEEINEAVQKQVNQITKGLNSKMLKDNPKLSNLQNSLHAVAMGEKSLSDVWSQMQSTKEFAAHKDMLNGIKNPVDQTYVLNSIKLALTTKDTVDVNHDTGKINLNKTVQQYESRTGENSRRKWEKGVFDKAGFSESVVTKIMNARDAWVTKNGEKSQVDLQKIGGAFGLSASRIAGRDILSPVEGTMDIAGERVPLSLTSSEKGEFLSKIPNSQLQYYAKQASQVLGKNLTVAQFITEAQSDGGSIQMDVDYCRNAQCLNGSLNPRFKVQKPGEAVPYNLTATDAAASSVVTQQEDISTLGIAVAGNLKKEEQKVVVEKVEEKKEDVVKTEPIDEEETKVNKKTPPKKEVTPPVKPQPQPEPKPTPIPKKEVTPPVKPQPQPEPKPTPIPKKEVTPPVKPQPQPEPKPTPIPKKEVTPPVKPQTQPEPKPKTTPKKEVTPPVKPKTQPQPIAKTDTLTKNSGNIIIETSNKMESNISNREAVHVVPESVKIENISKNIPNVKVSTDKTTRVVNAPTSGPGIPPADLPPVPQ
ncbi:hypothetical protein KGV52_00010 [Candidatus Gracilibacteria bacterium]|nr:hypothetical protein [Candidatus Gracilibacteria bacterium]